MADNSNNILNQLQQHTIAPPADAFEKAWKLISKNKITAAANQLPVIEDSNERKMFSQLQDYNMTAPALNFNAINGAVTNTNFRSKSRFIISLPLLRAASVALILAIAGVLFFTAIGKKETAQNNYTALGEKAGAVSKIIKSDLTDSSIATTSTGNDAAVKSLNSPERQTKKIINGKTIGGDNKKTKSDASFVTGNEEDKLYENDVLLTLVNYKSSNWERFFSKAVTEKRITLNKYSYHNLSDEMVAMLQNMYLTKKNGKPTRKAKKTSRKFEKWRKKDEQYFDGKMDKNPADLIDLSEFILKNK